MAKKKSIHQKKDNVVDISTYLHRKDMAGTMPGLFGRETERSPLQEAQQVMYDAWDAGGKKQRVNLARKALDISPDCADVYVLLAEETAKSLEEETELYRKGVEAGERAIGKKIFTDNAGHFWGMLETRPYMRARAGLARCLWKGGRREEAIGHYIDMICLNPNDNQGIRYVLVPCLIDLGRNDEASEIVMAYNNDPDAGLLYTKALLSYRKEKDSPASQKALTEAIEINPYVPDYLLGKKKIPKRLPSHVGFGDESKAMCYAADNISGWEKTPGALEWLQGVVAKTLNEL